MGRLKAELPDIGDCVMFSGMADLAKNPPMNWYMSPQAMRVARMAERKPHIRRLGFAWECRDGRGLAAYIGIGETPAQAYERAINRGAQRG